MHSCRVWTSLCCVNSVLVDGILDLCGVDAVVSGADEPVCGVSSVMTAGELDMFGYDSVVSDETGEVVSVDDIVACGDDPLLPDAVRVGGRLSVVGDILVCGTGRGDTEAWLDQELLKVVGWTGSSAQTIPCAPSHHRCTQFVCVVVYWQLPDIYQDMAIASASNTVCIYLRLVSYPCRFSYLHCIVYFYFVHFITGTADKKSWEGCRGQRFCIYL